MSPRGRSAASAGGPFIKEGGKGKSSRKPNDKADGGKDSNGLEGNAEKGDGGKTDGGKRSNGLEKNAEKSDKGKGRQIEEAGDAEDGEGEECDGEEGNEVCAPQKMAAAHDYRRQVTETLLHQIRLWRPEAVRKRKGGTMPYKHLPKFALDNQVRLFGWPVERILHFPGDPSFDVDKMLKREWEHLWRAGISDKSMGIEPWSPGTSELRPFMEYLLIMECIS